MNSLTELLREEIGRHGPMPFAGFMAEALYHPKFGYYNRSLNQIGKRGDFFTSVTVGSFFGELLAYQFARWMEQTSPSGPLHIVESGAHDGRLAKDILEAIQAHESDLSKRLTYLILEPSAQRRDAQQIALKPFVNVRWVEDFSEIKRGIDGVIFSNELLDAMPVHPFAWDARDKEWHELGVGLNGDQFVWIPLSAPTIAPPRFPDVLLDVLPDGYRFELSPQATSWWTRAASALKAGRIMAIDYGGTLEELLSPSRTSGTLRAYYNHRVSENVLDEPGSRDITAHVNFYEIQRAGEQSGLRTESFTTQGQFLTAIARDLWMRRGTWPAMQVRQFQTLTHEEHLGRAFRVLIQSR